MPAWLCQRNSVLLQPSSSGASAPFSAQWLRLRQGWQTRLQFPRPVSLGIKGCSTQPHCTGTSLTAEGCRPCLLANQSVAPRKDVRKQKGFCGDVRTIFSYSPSHAGWERMVLAGPIASAICGLTLFPGIPSSLVGSFIICSPTDASQMWNHWEKCLGYVFRPHRWS